MRADLFGLSQIELDRRGGAKRFAVAFNFAGRIRISGYYTHAVGFRFIRATRSRRTLGRRALRR